MSVRESLDNKGARISEREERDHLLFVVLVYFYKNTVIYFIEVA